MIPRIESKIDNAYANVQAKNKFQQVISDLDLCQKEIIKLQQKDDNPVFFRINNLTFEALDSSTYAQTKAYLDHLKRKYRRMRVESTKAREDKYYELIDKMGTDGLLELKKTSHNKNLINLVTNRNQIEKILETDDELIQKKDPIFNIPESRFGNAQFYAPVKRIGSTTIDTFYFNIIVIWLITAFFYLTLLHDTLRKIMDYLAMKFSFDSKN